MVLAVEERPSHRECPYCQATAIRQSTLCSGEEWGAIAAKNGTWCLQLVRGNHRRQIGTHAVCRFISCEHALN